MGEYKIQHGTGSPFPLPILLFLSFPISHRGSCSCIYNMWQCGLMKKVPHLTISSVYSWLKGKFSLRLSLLLMWVGQILRSFGRGTAIFAKLLNE